MLSTQRSTPVPRRLSNAARWMAAAVLLITGAAPLVAQGTTHDMQMPGMQMPRDTTHGHRVARKSAAKKPVAKKTTTRKAAPKKSPAAKPGVKAPVTTKAKAPPVHDMSGMADMPGMSTTDTTHRAHDMPAMSHGDTTHRMQDMPGMSAATARDTGSMAGMPGMAGTSGAMQGMTMMTPDPLGVSMDRMGSGTTWVPDAAPIPSLYFSAPGRWDVTGHGFAFLQYDRQGGPRGGSQLGSLNWLMLMASHALAGGRVQARTMLSLDALTVTPRGYPLLLQSGEAYDGAPLHDRQHPHDFFMELSALYERPVTHTVGIMLYAAPSGEPALGPVAFMHRPSAMDNPAAPISHHWADATHISFGVLSAGLFTHTLKLEGSLFNGREPDQQRFDFDPIRLDSWSGRLTYDPSAAWSFTGGYGFLASPEALMPGESMHRVAASALHGTTLGRDGQWASSLVYGANSHSSRPGWSHSLLLESEAVLDAHNTVFGRAEYVQKSAEELVLDTAPFTFPGERRFDVGEMTIGYIRDVARFGAGTLGLGAMGTVNIVPPALSGAYGSRTPLGAMIFLRVRPFRTGMTMRGPSDATTGTTPHAH